MATRQNSEEYRTAENLHPLPHLSKRPPFGPRTDNYPLIRRTNKLGVAILHQIRSSIGKLSAAFGTLNQETTFALANLNFDFSLVKVEPPREFLGLGNALSARRIESAERGTLHVTARRLTAFFEDLIPHMPNLFKAYGSRASEIASCTENRPKGSWGFFEEQVGVEGTSIWASATSGGKAIAIHLLACMLARIWSAPEAIAIWDELVLQRRLQLQKEAETDQAMRVWMASQLQLSTEELAEWDASARGWLRTADSTKALQQTQLRLVLENLTSAIDNQENLFTSVTHVWIDSMKTLDQLISGTHLKADTAATLLGLSAWHIYPDMIVIGDHVPTEIRQDDPLVKDGLLTIGVLEIGESALHSQEDRGIYWSLPLTHLRFYGSPTTSTRSIVSDKRLAASQLQIVALGSLANNWKVEHGPICSYVKLLYEAFTPRHGEQQPSYQGPETLSLDDESQPPGVLWDEANEAIMTSLSGLIAGAEEMLRAKGTHLRSCTQLFALGRRRCKEWLSPVNDLPPRYFGLEDPAKFLSLIQEKQVEFKILVLRHLAEAYALDPSDVFIRYRHYLPPSQGGKYHGRYVYAYANITSSTKRKRDEGLFKRWFSTKHLQKEDVFNFLVERERECGEECRDASETKYDLGDFELHRGVPYKVMAEDQTTESDWTSFQLDSEQLGVPYKVMAEDQTTESDWTSLQLDSEQFFQLPLSCTYLTGDHENASLWYKTPLKEDGDIDLDDTRYPIKPEAVPYEMIEYTLKKSYFNFSALLNHFSTFLMDSNRPRPSDFIEALNYRRITRITNLGRSLNALAHAAYVFQDSPEPISLSSTEGRLYKNSVWLRDDAFSSRPPTRQAAFSCILYFETGSTSLPPDAFDRTVALCTVDSIYASIKLLKDPLGWTQSDAAEVVRIKGNIGKSGIALLITPKDPLIRKDDGTSWRMINHFAFDGKPSDSFTTSSLHLSLTGYKMPINLQTHGLRHQELYMLESSLSLFAGAKWIADLDVLKALEDSKLVKFVDQALCTHKAAPSVASFPTNLTSLDDWDEILEPPEGSRIIRAQSNWNARLAASCLCARLQLETIVLREDVCWECVADHVSSVYEKSHMFIW